MEIVFLNVTEDEIHLGYYAYIYLVYRFLSI